MPQTTRRGVAPLNPQPQWHRRLSAFLPAWLHRRLLRFEAVIEDEVSRFARSLPPGTRVRSQGLWEGKKAECSVEEPMANSSMLVLPSMTMPAAFSRWTTVAS